MELFTPPDHLDRNPYRKLTVGLSHAWFGGFLAMLIPLSLIAIGYIAKEVYFDLNRGTSRNLNIWVDSTTDLLFTIMGAAMVSTLDYRYGIGVLLSGAAYFVAHKVFK